MKDPVAEARRWWAQALDDVAFVEWVKQEGRFFDKGCFLAQQAAEKALKAVAYAGGKRIVTGHSTVELWGSGFPEYEQPEELLKCCRRLDRFYIPTRYPNGLPGGIPASFFTAEDLDQAVQDARHVLDAVRAWLASRKVIE